MHIKRSKRKMRNEKVFSSFASCVRFFLYSVVRLCSMSWGEWNNFIKHNIAHSSAITTTEPHITFSLSKMRRARARAGERTSEKDSRQKLELYEYSLWERTKPREFEYKNLMFCNKTQTAYNFVFTGNISKWGKKGRERALYNCI